MNTPTPNKDVKELKDVPKKDKQDNPKDWGVKDDEPVTISQTKLGMVLVVCLLGVFGYLFWEKVKERQIAEKDAAESLEQMAQNEPVNAEGVPEIPPNNDLALPDSEQNLTAKDQFPVGQTTLTSHEQVAAQQTAQAQNQQSNAEDLFAQYQTQMAQEPVEQKSVKQEEVVADPFAAEFANQVEPEQKTVQQAQVAQEETPDLWAQFGENETVAQNNTNEEAVSDPFNQAAQFAKEQVAEKTEQAIKTAEDATQELFNFGEQAVETAQKTVNETAQQAFSPDQQVVIKKKQPADTSQSNQEEFFWGETDPGNTAVVQADPTNAQQQQPAEFDPFATAQAEVKPIEEQPPVQTAQQNLQSQQFDPSFFPKEQNQQSGKTTVVVDSSQQTKVKPVEQFSPNHFAQEQAPTTVIQQNPIAGQYQQVEPTFPTEQKTAQQRDPFADHQRLPVEYSQNATSKEPFRFDGHGGSPVQQVGHQEQISVYRVQPGDNYWRISRKVYGTAKYFSSLAEYNKARIPDPKKLQTGMKVLVPKEKVLEQRYPQLFKNMGVALNSQNKKKQNLPAGFFFSRDGRPMYRVGSEDTLTSIAQKHLGRSSRWIQIYQANRNQLKTPNRLKIGTVLSLPADASRISFAPNTSLR